MSKKADDARQRAFERGQDAWRQGKSREDNPYPPVSPDHDMWIQGWDQEDEIQKR